MIPDLCRAALLVALAAGVVSPALAARQAGEETKLTLGESSGLPGASVTVPLTLSAAESVNVGSVEMRLTYPKAQLTFNKVEPSGLSLGVDAKAEATVENGPDPKSSTVRVTLSTPPGEAGVRKPLPLGLLGYLGFTIAKTAKPETTISLVNVAAAATTDSEPRPIAPLAFANGKIKVTTRPVPACFFYMH